MNRSRLKIVGIFILVAGIVIVILGFQERAVSLKVQQEGVDVTARVTEHEVVVGRRGSKRYTISVEYQPKAGGEVIMKKFTVPRSIHDGSQDGEPIKVRYLPSDPTAAEVEGAGNNGIETIGAGAVIVAIGLAMCFFAFVTSDATQA
jgi:hypothetical protein